MVRHRGEPKRDRGRWYADVKLDVPSPWPTGAELDLAPMIGQCDFVDVGTAWDPWRCFP